MPVDDINVTVDLIDRIKYIQNKNIDICLVSNNSEARVKPVASKLETKYIYDAHKPLAVAFDKALEKLETKDKNCVAIIGDQMMSDIKGGNEYGLYTILVKYYGRAFKEERFV